ncbi:MAG: hypothetical protein AAF389_20835 [Gemmatimonadota bacterium]
MKGTFRGILSASVVMIATSACATAGPNVFEHHSHESNRRAVEVVIDDQDVCPVVVSNETGHNVDAVYRLDGVASKLGRIPSGRSISFGVRCDSGSIEAHAVSDFGGLLGGGQEYRTRSRIDRADATRLSFRLTDRIR